METIAVVGAGRIGLPIVRNLVRRGYAVRVLDVNAKLAQSVRDIGARWTPEVPELLDGAHVVFTILPGSPELSAVMLGGGRHGPGLLSLIGPTTTWIDLTSASPELGARLAEAAEERAVAYLEAPLGGGPTAAEDATLTLYAGGDESLLERHRTLLAGIAEPTAIRHLGGHGTGYLTKLLVNQLWFGQALAVGEALLLGQSAGLSPGALREVLGDSPASSAFITDYLPHLFAGDYLPSFGLDRCVEELESVQALADQLGTPSPLSGQVVELYRSALRHYGAANGELLGVAYLEHLAGRRLSDDRGDPGCTGALSPVCRRRPSRR
ncbi:MAG TPA: NAD(P)-dependent oxidoreductase [Actinospica sp.]|jgi:3-hydroxyisobutyrate dehydrogenase|nr:NAD(P)-dependent oxidoreductase [Actinospica sp.]